MRSNGITVQLMERLICALSYITFGIVGVIWIVISYIIKNSMSQFCTYNIYQSIFFSFFLYILSLICSIAAGFLGAIPVVGNFVNNFVIFFTQTPIYFGYTLWGFIVLVFICYFVIFVIFGRYPYIPFISDVINSGFRR